MICPVSYFYLALFGLHPFAFELHTWDEILIFSDLGFAVVITNLALKIQESCGIWKKLLSYDCLIKRYFINVRF